MYTSLTAPVLRGCWAIPVAVIVGIASSALGGAGLYLVGVYFWVYSAYCLANFARCGEAHCIVTGTGWTLLGAIAFLAGALQLPWLGPIWIAFVAIAVVGHGFELIWAAVRHTHVLAVQVFQNRSAT